MGQYFHIFANGDDARNFITSEEDFTAAFNRFAVCAFMFKSVKVQAFSIEESHPHCLVKGPYEECLAFKREYESMTRHYIVSSRGSLDDVIFELEILEIEDPEYLRNAAAYVIVQATKDGKQVMPYDYRWGTASMYFRPKGLPEIWLYDSTWEIANVCKVGSLTYREKHLLSHSREVVSDDWLVCNGLILPSNYVDVEGFEKIFGSFNRFRTFLSAGRKQLQPVVDNMIMARGVNLSDLEARKKAGEISLEKFGKRDSRWLQPTQRLELARILRQDYRLSFRQISTLCRLPEMEIRKYIR